LHAAATFSAELAPRQTFGVEEVIHRLGGLFARGVWGSTDSGDECHPEIVGDAVLVDT